MRKTLKIVSILLVFAMMITSFSVSFAAEKISRYKPIILLKFDDLTATNVTAFDKTFDILMEKGVTGGFGVIGKTLEDGAITDEFVAKVKEWTDAGIEIWHHGYYHTIEEYSQDDYATQQTNFGRTINLMEEKCGVKLTSFGSPYNNSNDTTMRVINENFPQIESLMLCSDPANEALAVNVKARADIEPETGKVNYEKFVANYEKQKRNHAVVLQGHPGPWTDHDRSELAKVIDFLKEKDSVFMTPTEYARYYAEVEKEGFEDFIEVTIAGSYVEFDDVEPTLINDRVVVPFRKIFASLGAEVEWDAETATATAKKGDIVIKITEDNNTAYIGDKACELDVAATILDGRFVVPIRFVSEALGQHVYWDGETTTVVIAELGPREFDVPEGSIEIKGCTFSSYFEDEIGERSYDGNMVTLWSCEGITQWVCYDFGEKVDFSKVSIVWNKGDARKAKFKIEVSDDAENFTSVFEGEASGQNALFEDYDVKGSGRYARIYCMGNNTSNWNAIKEIVFYK